MLHGGKGGQDPPTDAMTMSALSRFAVGIAITLLAFGSSGSGAFAQGTTGPNVIILLRLTGDSGALPQIRSCLAGKLSQMPDIEIATAPIDGVRLIVDIVAVKHGAENISASLVVAETFPTEQFRPRFKEGEDSDALLTSIRYYTLLRLHELVQGRTHHAFCARIAAEIGDKVLSKEYTERND
jgi:hypothetical protein